MDFKLAPDVNTVLMSFFLNCFQSLRLRIGTHGRLMILLVFLMLFWSLLFGLLMFCKYSVAMLVTVFLLFPFSVKTSIKKSISLWRCFSVHVLYADEKNLWILPLWYVVLSLSLLLFVHLLLMFSKRCWNHKSYYLCWW